MTTRNDYIDIARGLGIILVVIGHIIQTNCSGYSNNLVFQVIYSFHMPLFFFISGYVTYRLDWNPKYSWVLKKFTSLVIPYFIWFIISTLLNGYVFENGIVGVIRLMVTKYDMGYWFLLSLFLCHFALFLAIKLSRVLTKQDSLFLQIICCFVVLCLFWILQHFENYLGTSSVWAYFPYVICGYALAGWIQKHEILVNNKKYLIYGIVLGLVFLTLCGVKYVYNNMLLFERIMKTTSIKQFAYEIDSKLLALLAIAAVFCITFLLKNTFLCKPLTYLGNHTIEIYVIHFLLLKTYVDNIYVNSLICFVCALFIPLGIGIMLQKVSFVHKLLFGR